MSKVITFSRKFPIKHPRKGEPTFFIEKIWAGLADTVENFRIPDHCVDWDWHQYYNAYPKTHTIRSGRRWKVGDKFSPRYWSGKPYASKMVAFAPDIELKKVWDIEIYKQGDIKISSKEGTSNKSLITHVMNPGFQQLSKNDGLTSEDMTAWFKIPCRFSGQILCWNNKIEY